MIIKRNSLEFATNIVVTFPLKYVSRLIPVEYQYHILKGKGSNGDGYRAVDMGDGEEEQLFPCQGVRTWQRWRPVQQRAQQPLQPQLLQVLRFGEPKDGDDSAWWQRSVGGIGYHEDEEAEQAGGSASQVGHEEGVSSYGQGCYQSGIVIQRQGCLMLQKKHSKSFVNSSPTHKFFGLHRGVIGMEY